MITAFPVQEEKEDELKQLITEQTARKEEIAQDDPSGQFVHSLELVRFATFEYEPAGHGSSADAPSGQKLPPLHGLQATAPSSSWYEPSLHGAGAEDPASQKCPAVQSAQSSALTRLVAAE